MDEPGEAGEVSLMLWIGLNELAEHLIPELDVFTAASLGRMDVLAAHKEQLNKLNRGGWTSLMYAAYLGHATTTNWLLTHGSVQVDTRARKDAKTALMLATRCGHDTVVQALAAHGANVGSTLHCRSSLNDSEQLNLVDNRGWSALFHAVSCSHQSVVNLLLKSGASANLVDPKTGFTPLMLAAADGHQLIVQELLQWPSVKVSSTSHRGDTARSLAVDRGHIEVATLIDNVILAARRRADDSTQSSAGRPSILDGPAAFDAMIAAGKRRTSDTADAASITCRTLLGALPAEDEKANGEFNDTATLRSAAPAKPSKKGAGGPLSTATSTSTGPQPSTTCTCCIRCSVQCVHGAGPSAVGDILHSLGLAKYEQLFRDHDIDINVFLTLTDEDLRDQLGIGVFGPRKKITSAIARYLAPDTGYATCSRLLEARVERLSSQNAQLLSRLETAQAQVEGLHDKLRQERQLREVAEQAAIKAQSKSNSKK